MEDKHVEEIKRHFDIVMESLRDEIMLVIKGQQLLIESIERVEQGQHKIITRLDKFLEKI